MADECRSLAATIKEGAVRSQLLAVAEHFERLAETQHHFLVSRRTAARSGLIRRSQ
jgi:hypothetical protein